MILAASGAMRPFGGRVAGLSEVGSHCSFERIHGSHCSFERSHMAS